MLRKSVCVTCYTSFEAYGAEAVNNWSSVDDSKNVKGVEKSSHPEKHRSRENVVKWWILVTSHKSKKSARNIV
jgi:Zn-finger protein